MNLKRLTPSRFALFGAGAFLVCVAAFAHHSFAMYDNEHQVKLKGAVAQFQWTNPHVYIELLVADGDSEKHWSIECASPSILNRGGWKFNMIKPGDTVKLVVAPIRTGDTAALLKEVVLPDGRVLSNGGPAGPALIHWDEK